MLAAQGHTVVVIEHHTDILRAVDWLIEVGPEAADQGGEIVYEGLPAGIKKCRKSITRPFLLN